MYKRLVPLGIVLVLAACDARSDYRAYNQNIEGPFSVSNEWLLVTPDTPLKVDRAGLQRLHIVMDDELYQPNALFIEDESDDPWYLFALRGPEGELIKPEVVVIADNGQEIVLTPTGNTGLYTGGVTVALGMFEGIYVTPPDYPESIEHFVAFRVRSNHPVQAIRFRWSVDRHPDMFR